MTTLQQQIAAMIENGEDWIPSPVGIDTDYFAVVNRDGEAWLVLHNGECDMDKFTPVRIVTG